MEEQVRNWIVSVLKEHPSLVSLAVRQRAKFEGWLKFELAAYAESHGATQVEVEIPGDTGNRSDLSFRFANETVHVELKTPNTSWRMEGVVTKIRPTTNNLQSVVIDADKLRNCPGTGIVAFVIFPVPREDARWAGYLERISSGTGIPFSHLTHATRVKVSPERENSVELVVCAFRVPKPGEAYK